MTMTGQRSHPATRPGSHIFEELQMFRKVLTGLFVFGLASVIYLVLPNEQSPFSEALSRPLGQPCSLLKQVHDCGSELACVNGVCSHCSSDYQCSLSYDWLLCSATESGIKLCQHKDVFPMTRSELISTLLSLVIGCIAAGGGVGGGGAIVTILIIFNHFSAAHAVPVSKGFVFGGAIANLSVLWRRRHPVADRPMVDFKTAILLLPPQIIGTQIGVTFNRILPNWCITLGLVCTLTYMAFKMFKKGRELHTTECAIAEASERDPILVLEGPSAEAQNRPVHPEVSAILEEESRVPWGGLFRCVALSVIVLLCSLFKGGEHDSVIGVKCGNPIYWVLFFVPFFFIAATMVWQGIQMRIQYDKKVQLHYPFQDGDIMWNGSNVFLCPLLCTAAGFCSGCFGVGGGTIAGPLMLHLGMKPQIVAATTPIMVLFTSTLTSVQFLLLGSTNLSYAAWYLMLGIVSSFIGQHGIAYVLEKYKKQSVIIFLIALILLISDVGLGVDGTISIIADAEVSSAVHHRLQHRK